MQGPYKVRVAVGANAMVLDVDANAYAVSPPCTVFYRDGSIVSIVSMANLIDIAGEPDPEPVETDEPEVEVDPEAEPAEYVEPEPPRGMYL